MSHKQPAALIDQPTLTPEQEQEKWLGEALRNVKDKAAYLTAAMREVKFVQVLRYASQMLSELRTGMLTPQNYYELYQKVFDELSVLEMFLSEEVGRGRPIEDMYEVVQHAGNIVPRLYLLFTVGTVYIKSKKAPCCEILKDMVEMCKGVQHPTRGLFLRSYLLTITKSVLPDVGNDYEGEGGTVEDSINFILQNFKEMVWLWVRMEKLEHLPKSRREKERRELRVLVGFNLVRLGQLDGVTRKIYQDVVLPSILNIILAYKEPLAQQYLLEAIIHVFPDEYHLMTLSELLTSFQSVVAGVNIHSIFISLMDRLGNYVEALREGTTEGGSKKEVKVIRQMFEVFLEQISELANQGIFGPAAFADTQMSLLKLVMKTYPGEYDRIDEVLAALKTQFAATKLNDAATKSVRKLIEYLFDASKNIGAILDLPSLDGLVDLLNFKSRRDIALSLCHMAAAAGEKITTLERVAKLFDIISPIVKETPENPNEIYTIDPEEEFIEEQNTVCRVMHLIDCDDLPTVFKMYSGVRKQLGQGGMERMRHTLKAMASLYVRLAIRVKKAEAAGGNPGVQVAKPFQYVYSGDGKGILEILVQEMPIPTFFHLLSCATAADTCELPDLSYDLFTEAFTVYEEHTADSKDQNLMLCTMVSSLCALRSMPDDSYDVVATKVCQYSSKLLKKHDQCRMAAVCSHLFWKKILPDTYHKKVMECMQRSLKISDNVTATFQLSIYIELLNHFLFYYGAQTPGATVKYISTLIDLISAGIKSAESGEVEAAGLDVAKQFFKNTRKFVLLRQQTDERWKEIII